MTAFDTVIVYFCAAAFLIGVIVGHFIGLVRYLSD